MTGEQNLIQQAAEGSTQAAAELFRSYQDKVYGYLLRLTRRPDLADDAAQETFLRAYKGLPRYTEQGRFAAWLFRIAHREGLRLLRREKLRSYLPFGPGVPEAQAGLDGSPEHVLRAGQSAARLEAALSGLTPQERATLLLRLQEDMRFKDIAGIMGCSLNTALGRMHNARRKLKKALEQEGDAGGRT